MLECQLADFLVFLRRVLSSRVMKTLSLFIKWVDPLMAIISSKCSLGNFKWKTNYFILHISTADSFILIYTVCLPGYPCFQNLRTKLLAFHVLERLLPACSEPEHVKKVGSGKYCITFSLLLEYRDKCHSGCIFQTGK